MIRLYNRAQAICLAAFLCSCATKPGRQENVPPATDTKGQIANVGDSNNINPAEPRASNVNDARPSSNQELVKISIDIPFKLDQKAKFSLSPNELKKLKLGYLKSTVESCRKRFQTGEQTENTNLTLIFLQDSSGSTTSLKDIRGNGNTGMIGICVRKIVDFRFSKAQI